MVRQKYLPSGDGTGSSDDWHAMIASLPKVKSGEYVHVLDGTK